MAAEPATLPRLEGRGSGWVDVVVFGPGVVIPEREYAEADGWTRIIPPSGAYVTYTRNSQHLIFPMHTILGIERRYA